GGRGRCGTSARRTWWASPEGRKKERRRPSLAVWTPRHRKRPHVRFASQRARMSGARTGQVPRSAASSVRARGGEGQVHFPVGGAPRFDGRFRARIGSRGYGISFGAPGPQYAGGGAVPQDRVAQGSAGRDR